MCNSLTVFLDASLCLNVMKCLSLSPKNVQGLMGKGWGEGHLEGVEVQSSKSVPSPHLSL